MRIERVYRHNTEQLLAAADDVAQSHPGLPRMVRRWRWGCVLGGILLIYAGWTGDYVVWLGPFGVLLIIGGFTTFPWLIRKEFKRGIQEQFLCSYQHVEIKLTLSEEGVVEEWEVAVGPWKGLKGSFETDLHLGLEFTRGILIYVPKDVGEEFINALRSKLQRN